jgi:dihydrofolate reductase
MGQVIASASMSLDGYIAKDDNTIGRLFDWLQNGPVAFPTVNDDITLHLTARSAEYLKEWVEGLGALVCGRTLFDFTGGWHFVTDGVEAAVARAQAIAGERTVAVTAGTIARQCLELGLLDAVAVDLVPVVMGKGRPYFGEMSLDDAPLGDPTACIQGDRVMHLMFPVIPKSSRGRV